MLRILVGMREAVLYGFAVVLQLAAVVFACGAAALLLDYILPFGQ